MPLVSLSSDFAPGVLTSSAINTQVIDQLNFLIDKPRLLVRQTTVQSIASNINGVAVPWDLADIDFNIAGVAQWASGSPTRLVPYYTGTYWLDGGVSTATNAAGVRGAAWYVNGSPVNGGTSILSPASGQPTSTPAKGIPVYLNGVVDYVELRTIQTTGGAINSSVATADYQPTAAMYFLGYR